MSDKLKRMNLMEYVWSNYSTPTPQTHHTPGGAQHTRNDKETGPELSSITASVYTYQKVVRLS